MPAAPPIVAFGVGDSDEQIVTWAGARVAGYALADGSLHGPIAAIEGAIRGEVVCSPRSAAALFRRLAS
jgi:DNA-binding NarL/FixJ family response regulator